MLKRRRRAALFALVLAGIAVYAVHACAGPRDESDGSLERHTQVIDAEHSISFLRAGDSEAPRVIYVHGSPGDALAWRAYLNDPVSGLEAIAIDRFGYGKTTPAKPEPSLEAQAKAIEPFLIQRKGRWPILVGHSMGAPVIARAAVDYPDRVGGLVLVSGSLDPAMEKVAWYQRVGDFWVVPKLLPVDWRTCNRELMPLKGELELLGPLLANVKCPIVIIHGTKDWLVPVSNVDYMREHFLKERILDVELLVGKSHFLPWTDAGFLRSAIEKIAAPPAPKR